MGKRKYVWLGEERREGGKKGKEGETNIEFPQHNIQLPSPPRLALAEILGSHSLSPEREVFLRVFPHIGSVTGMVTELFERGEHC